ncbi:hypothetical protein L484_004247 [Morus notabilis]|uniref:Nodulin-related protein 1 n=1 Tax=Morus notabilis TaxID=981085 RepID=W9R228_9ROSA|nr:nodulin-related protein 1 [Morus notabilis]EXB65071.1 hypothetical protein L484_004247 [Morus notabilis]
MDLLKSLAGGHGDKPAGEDNKPGNHGHRQKSSTTELLSSAKEVADAAKFAASNQSDKIDKGKAAGAGADLLDAAAQYGKLGEKGVGEYVHKAGDYLHQYEAKNTAAGGGGGHDHAKPSDDHHHGDDQKKSDSEGGFGDYFKAAQGFLKK